ncbi:MAG: DUF4270 family protein [Chitinophagaceae bacterium]
MKKFFLAIFSIATFIILEQSCQKIDTTTLGLGLIPPVDNINTFDTTLDVITRDFFLTDSTQISRNDNHALGILDDPEFGKTTANIYFDLLPINAGSYPFLNKDSIKGIDSVVLSIDYTGLYGDSNSIEKIHVYEIAQSASFLDTLYKLSDPDFDIVPKQLGEATVNFTTLNDPQVIRKGTDTVLVTEENILRIPLDKTLGQRLAAYDTTTAYKNDSVFITLFKGIALKVDAGSPRNKALAYFNLSDNAKTRLTVYYRVGNSTKIDTTFTEFVYKDLLAKGANLLRREITGTPYAANIASPSVNKDKLYLQSTPGSYATLTIPGLNSLSNRVIQRAELLIQKVPSAEDVFFAPPVLFLDMIDSTNRAFLSIPTDFVTDYQGTYNASDFGGVIKNDLYTFNLSRHIQSVVTRKNKVYSYRIYAPYSTWPIYSPAVSLNGFPIKVNGNIAAGRVVVGGGSNTSKKMRLRIIYTKI